LCKDGGKDFRQWKRLERAQELISFYDAKSCRGDPHGSFYEVEDTHENKIKTNIGQSRVFTRSGSKTMMWLINKLQDNMFKKSSLQNFILNATKGVSKDQQIL